MGVSKPKPEPQGDSGGGDPERGNGDMKGEEGRGWEAHEKGLGRIVLGDMRSCGRSVNFIVFASAISSISSNEGIEIIGRTVSIEEMPLGRLMIVGVALA